MSGTRRDIDASGRTITISSFDKVYFPADHITKGDLVEYYMSMAEPLLRQLRDRPVMLQRYPDGIDGASFYQKRITPGAPDWLQTVEVRTVNGTASRALVIADIAHLLWAVNLGCIGFHSWPVRASNPQRCDELRIDLDPSPGTDFAMVCAAAEATKAVLDEVGMIGHLKTSGSRGLHIYVRLVEGYDSFSVRRAAVALARRLEQRHPQLLTAAWWKEQRGRRIFVDFNQNAPHRTMFAPWCVRALPGAPVSTPVAWPRLRAIRPPELNLRTVGSWLLEQGDAWAQIDRHPQRLDVLLGWADDDERRGLPDAPWPPEYPKMSGEATRVAPSRARRSGG